MFAERERLFEKVAELHRLPMGQHEVVDTHLRGPLAPVFPFAFRKAGIAHPGGGWSQLSDFRKYGRMAHTNALVQRLG